MRTVRLDITRPHDADQGDEPLKKATARALGLGPSQVDQVRVVKRALDARARMGAPTWRLTVDAQVRGEPGRRADPRAQVRAATDPPVTLDSPRAPADYRLAHTTAAGRGVYSFCMCPGGMVVPTSTEPEMVVVNGMSSARRSGPFANSGLVAQVELQDLAREGFGGGPLAGVEFQRALERRAFDAGGRDYKAPAMRAADLAAGRFEARLAPTRFRPGLVPEDLREVLPAFVAEGLQDALRRFDQVLRGYASSEANLIAVESRTSSPVRIPRDPATRQVPGFDGLYVAGEGPGYAGGIMSAALDGLHTGHAVLVALAG